MSKEEELQKTRSLLEDTSDDLEHYVFNTENICLYDLKAEYSFEHVKPKRYKKKIYKSHNLQILGICDDTARFVVNPKKTLQITKYGGTVKLLRLEKGYSLQTHCKEETRGISGEVEIEGAGSGVKVAIDNSYLSQFKMNMGKLTHEHLVMITDTDEPLCHGSCLRPYRDIIDMELDYLKIDKDREAHLWTKLGNAKYRRIYHRDKDD